MLDQTNPLPFLVEGNLRLTPAQAGAVLRHAYHPRQRRLSPEHVANLRDTMEAGRWNPKDQLSFARVDRRLILLNGHHRMTAQAQSTRDILWNVVIHDCQTEIEAIALYFRYDTNVRKRNVSNIVAGAEIDHQFGLPAKRTAALLKAMPPLAAGLSFSRKNDAFRRAHSLPDHQIELARGYLPEAQLFDKWTSGSKAFFGQPLWKPAILATALATIRHQPDIAEQFWRGLYLDDGLKQGDPRKALLGFLVAARRARNEKMDTTFYAVGRAWNAWLANRPLQLLKPMPGNPLKLEGTPYTIGGSVR